MARPDKICDKMERQPDAIAPNRSRAEIGWEWLAIMMQLDFPT
jgi:hypothetical protein